MTYVIYLGPKWKGVAVGGRLAERGEAVPGTGDDHDVPLSVGGAREEREEREEEVARLDDLRHGHLKPFNVGGRSVVLIRVDDQVFAVKNQCTHARSALGPGRLTEDGLIECPMHGALFSPHDGTVRKGPAKKPITTYPVRLEDGSVFIDMSRSSDE